MPAATPALVKRLPWAGRQPHSLAAIRHPSTQHSAPRGPRCLRFTSESARAQGGEGLLSWHGPLLSAQPGTRRPPWRGDPSLRCSCPGPLHVPHPAPKKHFRSHLSLSLPSTVLCCGCCSGSSLFAGGEAESRGDLGLPPTPTPATHGVGSSGPLPGLLCETSRPPASTSSGIYGAACKRTSHPDKIETFLWGNKNIDKIL